MRNKKDLTNGEIAEMKELYLGTWKSIRELSKLFNVSKATLRWLFDYKDYRNKQTERNAKWRKGHPKRAKEINIKAQRKWIKNHPEEHKLRVKKHSKKWKRKK